MVVFASKKRRTEEVVNKIKVLLNLSEAQVHYAHPALVFDDDSWVLFVCPAYGDDELHLDMDDLIGSLKTCRNRYAICELGNYYGYEQKDFGCARIIRQKLNTLGGSEFHPSLSLDSLPELDWSLLIHWGNSLSDRLRSESDE